MASLLALHSVVASQQPSWFSSPCLLQQRRPVLPTNHLRLQKKCAPRLSMGLKIVHTYDSSFELKPECREKLHSLLNSAAFRNQLKGEITQKSNPESEVQSEYEFTGELFQPVPWSMTTRHGMPQEFEKYHGHPDYVITNVPPNFMFQAKIFRPSRLCAIFRKVQGNVPDE